MARIRHLIVACILLVSAWSLPALAAVSKQQAMAQCQAYASNYQQSDTSLNFGGKCVDKPASNGAGVYQCQYKRYAYYNGPVGDETCGDYPYDNSDSCASAAPIAGSQSWPGSGSNVCKNGCQYSPTNVAVGMTVGAAAKMFSPGGLTPTGQECTAADSQLDATPKEQECTPVDGQTICAKSDGRVCATASTGKQLCWKPGETGKKTEGAELADRQGGTQHTAPNLQLPSGDTLEKKGGPTTVTSTTSSGGTSSTVTTNVTTYKTTNGTDAGSKNEGEGDGKGEDGEGNGASGGGDCKSAPIVTGDAALGMIATQAWATRCAVEAGNATKVTGDIGDCKSGFTVEGDNAQAHQLRAMRAARCGDGPEWAKPKNGEGSNSDPHAGASDKDGPGWSSLKVGADLLDTSGFGGGSCPTLGTIDLGRFGQVSLDGATWWCPLIAALRAVMLLIGVFIALQLLMGD